MLLLVVGTAVRVCQYAARTSFWSDEASIFVNVTQLNARQLMGPLLNEQAAPPGFLWIERGLALAFGTNEFSLRLYPLLAGIAAFGLFAALAWRLFDPPVALCVIGFFAFADKLIAYCGEAKQYSSDVLAATVLMSIALWPSEKLLSSKRLPWLCVAAAVAIWFSHTSIFIFAAASLYLSGGILLERPRRCFTALAANLLVVASFAGLFLGSIRFEHQKYLYEFWSKGFPPERTGMGGGAWLVAMAEWLGSQTKEVASFAYPNLSYLVMGLILIGAVGAMRRRRYGVVILGLLPLLLVLMASLLGQYPFVGSRLTLFLFPGAFLLSGEALRSLQETRWPAAKLWWVAAAPALAIGIVEASYHVYSPRYHSHIRPVVEYVRAHRKADEAIYFLGDADTPAEGLASAGHHLEYLCYWPDPPAPIYTALPDESGIHQRRFWIVLPLHADRGVKPIQGLLETLRSFADEKDKKVVKQGGAAFLFEKRQP